MIVYGHIRLWSFGNSEDPIQSYYAMPDQIWACNHHSSAVFTTVSRRNDIVASLFVQKGNTPLHIGALGGHVPVVRMLVENGASIDAKSQVFTQRPAIFILHRCVKTRLCSVWCVESFGKLH